MDNSKIAEAVARHAARNRELAKLIVSKKADLDAPRLVDLQFWAPSETSASQLGLALEEAGLLNVVTNRASDDGNRWNVEGQVHRSVREVGDENFVQRLVHLAAAHESEFDGWGTSL